jgi:hypothetical protein
MVDGERAGKRKGWLFGVSDTCRDGNYKGGTDMIWKGWKKCLRGKTQP